MKKQSAKSPRTPPQKKAQGLSGAVPSSVNVKEIDIERQRQFFGAPDHRDPSAIAPLYFQLKEQLHRLYIQASAQNEIALEHLVWLGVEVADILVLIASESHDFAKSVAIKSESWPVAISTASIHPQDLDELRRELEIGREFQHPFNFSKRYTGKPKTLCRKILTECLNVITSSQKICRMARILEASRPKELFGGLPEDYGALDQGEVCNAQVEKSKFHVTYLRKTVDGAMIRFEGDTVELLKTLGVWPQSITGWELLTGFVAKPDGLPPQSLESFDQWFGVIEFLITACCEGKPGRSRVLMALPGIEWENERGFANREG